MSSPRIVPSTNESISGARTAIVSRAASSNGMSAWTSTGRALAKRSPPRVRVVPEAPEDDSLANAAGARLDPGAEPRRHVAQDNQAGREQACTLWIDVVCARDVA